MSGTAAEAGPQGKCNAQSASSTLQVASSNSPAASHRANPCKRPALSEPSSFMHYCYHAAESSAKLSPRTPRQCLLYPIACPSLLTCRRLIWQLLRNFENCRLVSQDTCQYGSNEWPLLVVLISCFARLETTSFEGGNFSKDYLLPSIHFNFKTVNKD